MIFFNCAATRFYYRALFPPTPSVLGPCGDYSQLGTPALLKATWIATDLPSNYYKTILTDFLNAEFITRAYDITDLCAIYYSTKGTERCLASKKQTILGHQHNSAHKITSNLLKKRKNKAALQRESNSLPPGLWTALLIDLQPMLWKLNVYWEKFWLYFRQGFLSATF